MSSRTLTLVAAVVLLIAGGALYVVLGGGGLGAPGARAPADAPAAPAAPGPGPAAAPEARAATRPGVRRLADAAERERVMAAIVQARARRRAAASSGAAAGPAGPPPSLPEPEMSKDDIKDGVHAIAPLLAECYDQARDRGPVPHRTVIRAEVKVTGEPDVGSLIESADLSSEDGGLADPAFAECLHETMMSVELPPLPDGGVITFTYPFVFSDGA